ncbi:F0F1 ATP synthase subunit gamma [Novipirellula artificiosorum]|uniref:ATP synthase gamma chain n=1 Tax=Novipirellula artificiosorum TaxID=2528016 RepID=A0A5C6DS80_9BACT|nr:F0F1 ATP synthase subunit gamma [Novipirellula artificiosorum]TWU38351.1 ATP synthase gamma chain [Novipirellula artificiosorum]
MTTLENLRRQIDTATDLNSVVSTMKTLAAVSIHQYEQAADALADYNRTVELGFQIALRGERRALDQPSPAAKIGAIVFGSDQGMCGQFNERIAEFAIEYHRQASDDPPTGLLVVGARARAAFIDVGWKVDETYSVPTSVSEINDLVQAMIPRIEQLRTECDIGAIHTYSNRRAAASSFESQHSQLLPIDSGRVDAWRERKWQSRSLPTFAAPRRQLISQLARQYLLVSLYRVCAESLASENASRIAAMQAAEKNIEERLDELQSDFNRLRQSAITEELLDVVTGFEALRTKHDGSPP